MQETLAFDKNKMQSKPDSDKPWQMLWFFYMSTNCLVFHGSLEVHSHNLVEKSSHLCEVEGVMARLFLSQ